MGVYWRPPTYTYTLDQVGNRKSVEEYGGRKVEYTYDELHRLTKEVITDPVNGDSATQTLRERTIEYTYDAVGNRYTKNDSVFGLTTYTYDEWILPTIPDFTWCEN